MSFETHTWQPIIMDARIPSECALLRRWLEHPGTVVYDKIETQIDELISARDPTLDRAQVSRMREYKLASGPVWSVGRWVYYPWSRALVHTLAPAEFVALRCSRNRDKITAEEQARLARARIGIVGLSVGRSIAQTLAMEGVGRRFRLADGDRLALSNLNRVPGSLTHIGVPKAVLAARALLEMDPFLDIEVFDRGVEMHRLDDFVGAGDCRLDVLVEECDDLAVKVGLREHARAARVPVLMETSERGTLDVERFDLEPERPILHGLLDDLDVTRVRDLAYVKQIITRLLPTMSERTRRSLEAVGSRLASWPQLASEIALGAATVTAAARHILLGDGLRSGRYQTALTPTTHDNNP